MPHDTGVTDGPKSEVLASVFFEKFNKECFSIVLAQKENKSQRHGDAQPFCMCSRQGRKVEVKEEVGHRDAPTPKTHTLFSLLKHYINLLTGNTYRQNGLAMPDRAVDVMKQRG